MGARWTGGDGRRREGRNDVQGEHRLHGRGILKVVCVGETRVVVLVLRDRWCEVGGRSFNGTRRCKYCVGLSRLSMLAMGGCAP